MNGFKAMRDWAATSTLAHVGFAFIAMGAWGVFANRGHPLPAMLLAGFVQGTISAVLTLCLKRFLEWMSARLRGLGGLIVPPLITATAIGTILTTAHTLAGTPEILATIAVPFTISTSYAILYNLRLWRQNGRQ